MSCPDEAGFSVPGLAGLEACRSRQLAACGAAGSVAALACLKTSASRSPSLGFSALARVAMDVVCKCAD